MKEGLKRVAVISSRVVFKNACKFDWRLSYIVGDVASDILLKPNVKMGLPFDL
jgi:histidinol phosphatase-like enzyme